MKIKFRVWLPWLKRITQVSNIEFSWQTGEISNICYILPEHECEFEVLPEDVVLMQFTGLKDKEGQDIYEGDILKDGRDGDINEVVRIEGGFLLANNNFDYFRGYADTMEVVGNVYEDTGLLTSL